MNLGYRHTSIAPPLAGPQLSRSAGSGGKGQAQGKGSHDGALPEPHGRLRRHGQQARAAAPAVQDAQEEAIEQPRPPDAAGPREDAQVIIAT